MRSFRNKLILIFLVVSMAGTLITTLVVRFSNQQALNELLTEQNQEVLVTDLQAFYETHGTWDGAAQEVFGQGATQPVPEYIPFALVDSGGVVIIPNSQYPPGAIIPVEELLTNAITIEIDGEYMGSVLTNNRPPPMSPQEQAYIVAMNRALIYGALGATAVAVILAFFMARMVTLPLKELSEASHLVAGGELQQKVRVRSQDELGRLAMAFNRMSAELEQANQARRQMTADIAHDLRTPLTVLSGYLEVMEDGTLSPTSERFAMMGQEVQTLERLVADLRVLTLGDSGKLVLQKEPVSVSELLNQMRDSFAQKAAQGDVSILVSVDEGIPEVFMDASRIRQMLGNLIDNALRYTPVKGKIALSAEMSADGELRIRVADTGNGIPEEDLPLIFNRFYRGDRSRQESEGSGLGLAIAKSLIQAHSGTISVKSTHGTGTEFTILLPMK